jgi:hypothetical protein
MNKKLSPTLFQHQFEKVSAGICRLGRSVAVDAWEFGVLDIRAHGSQRNAHLAQLLHVDFRVGT